MLKEENVGIRVENEGGSATSLWLYVLFVIVVVVVLWIFYPKFIPEERKALENKIESAESFYNEAKALSLSMPLLNDSVVYVVADSLLATIVDLNQTWVIYVRTQEGFENYTSEIEKLNNNIDRLRVEYEVAKVFRGIENFLKEGERLQREWKERKRRKIET